MVWHHPDMLVETEYITVIWDTSVFTIHFMHTYSQVLPPCTKSGCLNLVWLCHLY